MNNMDILPFRLFDAGRRRWLQQPNIPNYTSPPLEDAIQATPEAYRSDDVIDAARAAAAAGNCTTDGNRCHIPFVPPSELYEPESSQIGVIFYGGGLVDPRSYSPIAEILASRYGFPVVVPIFDRDIALGFGGSGGGDEQCDSGRIDLAVAEFDFVQRWVLAGHSLGGSSAMVDVWNRLYSNNSNVDDMDANLVGGLAMIASDVQNVGCGETNFSTTNLPMASVTASLDQILNKTRSEINQSRLSNDTLMLDIFGGNHGQFGSYNYSERTELLGQVDGVAIIPPQVQWDLTTAAIFHVASRLNVSLPKRLEQPAEVEIIPKCPDQDAITSSSLPNTYCYSSMWAPLTLAAWLLKKL